MSTLEKSNKNKSSQSETSSLAQKIQQAKQNKQQQQQQQQPVMTSTKKLSQDKSFGQIIDPIQLNTGYTINTTNNNTKSNNNTLSQNTVTFREPESTLIDSGLNLSKISNVVTTETIQKLANNYNLEKNDIAKLIEDNKTLEKTIQELQTKLLEQKSKDKQEIDRLIAKLYDSTQNETDKEEIKMLFISEQQETSEKLINEQDRTIKLLKFKCKRLESELAKSNETNNSIKSSFNNL
jgi:hypothetical protein